MVPLGRRSVIAAMCSTAILCTAAAPAAAQELSQRAEHAAMAAPDSGITDTPNQHNMFILGEETLFVAHMPMFWKEDHRYQVILRVSLPDQVMQAIADAKAADPDAVPNLVNSKSNTLILPDIGSGAISGFDVDVFAGYDGGSGNTSVPLAEGVPLRVEQVVEFRHFDFDFAYPARSTYLVFGRGNEAHMARYLSHEPDFQHLLTLPAPPGWIDEAQLAAGFHVNIDGITGSDVPCSDPLTRPEYEVTFQGLDPPLFSVELGTDATRWFSTANFLNATDPCG